MVKMLATSSVTSVWQAGRYRRESMKTLHFPRVFHLAFALTSLILALSYLLILADIWLHGSSSIVEGTIATAVQSPAFGLAFNGSICTGSSSCLNDTGSWASSQSAITQSGLLIATNSSNSLSVITLSNTSDLAVVVPKSVDSPLIFEAPSFGIRAQCANQVPNCAGSPSACSESVTSLAKGGNGTASTNGTAASNNYTSAVPTLVLPTSTFPANPQSVMLQLHWNGTVQPANSKTTIQTSSGDILAWASCDLTFYNLTLRYQDGNYSVAGEPVLADPAFANIMQGALVSHVGNLQLMSNLQAAVLAAQDEPSALAAMNQELSRLTLALFAGTLQPAPSTSLSTAQQSALFGRYPFAPVIVYLFLLYAYSFTAGGIYIWAARLRSPFFRAPGRKTTTALQLVHLRLTDPLALVASIYPSYADCPAPDDPREMFLEDDTTSRLEIGTDDGVNAHPVFGIYRRAGPWSAEFVEMR
ncbi:hypothetical protein DFH07DRAFT_362114 [Mycena maculata]|uniref:Uncharacterized protein n=1 Tax=Mycena maculata TaxID=230809 RepID=A0AAD7MGA7_9AGAR|nr:hypothetical protein DFH07DRAFT_362114 [Mycena maculata]